MTHDEFSNIYVFFLNDLSINYKHHVSFSTSQVHDYFLNIAFLLCNHNMSKPGYSTLIQDSHVVHRSYSELPIVLIMSFRIIFSWTKSSPESHSLVRYLYSPLIWNHFPPLSFMTLLKDTGQLFYRMSFGLYLPVSLWLDSGYAFLAGIPRTWCCVFPLGYFRSCRVSVCLSWSFH